MQDRVIQEGAVVPTLWHYEVSIGLWLAGKHGRITIETTDKQLGMLHALPITTDDTSTQQALQETLKLARQNNLTSYDVAYLELALRRNIPLATKDSDLRKAAKNMA